MIDIKLEPLGKTIQIEANANLQDVLFEFWIEFPCGGDGHCGKCKIRLLEGNLKVNDLQQEFFTEPEIADGWRLACQCRVTEPVTLELVQWEMQFLSDDKQFQTVGRTGYAVAVDLGTTTLVAQLIDLKTGNIISTQTALNPQAKYGADIMSRIDYAMTDTGSKKLQILIRTIILNMILELIRDSKIRNAEFEQIIIVGNTVMHHLFCGIDITPLSRVPFETANGAEFIARAKDIGWLLPGNPELHFLPCLGGFVGSDVLAGIISTELHNENELMALIDLGTNGEVVVGNRKKILCASTAAGPAFEGAKISMGMRATSGAISKVIVENGQLAAHVIGGGPAQGVCGSGLVDAVACALDLGFIDKSGRIVTSDGKIVIQNPVVLTQQDVREMQLAKAAIAAGLEILVHRLSRSIKDIDQVYIAGAFGNYINVENAAKIGLLGFDHQKMVQAGNTALQGAKQIVVHQPKILSVMRRTKHIALATDAEFMERYIENMKFSPA